MRLAENRERLAILVYSILFLFFFQLITDFVAGLYANGVMAGQIPPEIPVVVLFLSPFLLLLFGRVLSSTAIIVMGQLVLLSRALAVFLPTTRGQLLVAGVGTAIFLLFLPALLWERGRKGDSRAGFLMAAGLMLAVAWSILLRSLGSTIDLSGEGMFRAIILLVAILAAVFMPWTIRADQRNNETSKQANRGTGWGKSILLGTGIISILTLLYFAFTSPVVMARWTEANYLLIMTVATLALVFSAWLFVTRKKNLAGFSHRWILALTLVFVLALTLTLWAHQVTLPVDSLLYPLADPEVSAFWIVPLLFALILFPVLFLDFALLARESIISRPTLGQLGTGFGLASLLMLVLVLSNVFTSAWAYVDPFLEPFFRYKFWLFHMVPGVLLILSLIVVSRSVAEQDAEVTTQRGPGRSIALLVTALGFASIAAVFLSSPEIQPTPEPAGHLKVAGYNIHQGYDVEGQRSHWNQCVLLREIDADVIGLSESDTARIAGGNFDAPRYLAECLDQDSYVAPKTGAGTFGYALLSKYLLENSEAYHLFSGPGFPSVGDPERTSEGDQVAIIGSSIRIGNERFNIFVNHFDSYPPREQVEGFLKVVDGLDRVIAIGDYNCEPSTECFTIITEQLVHCADFDGDPEVTRGQVDHIFVSPDLQCQNFTYVESTASDHPVVVAEILW